MTWTAADYRVPPQADAVAAKLFRTDFGRPGFAAIDVDWDDDLPEFRRFLLGLAAGLSDLFRREFGRPLHLRSVGRFDQQASTRPHRDGAPDESILLLGYEPTTVASRLFVLDHSRCAHEMNLTPQQFLDRHHLQAGAGEQLLLGHTTEIVPFEASAYRVVVVNNSNRPFVHGGREQLGVLHQALVARPDPTATRHVNSLTLAAARADEPSLFTEDDLRRFVEAAESAAR